MDEAPDARERMGEPADRPVPAASPTTAIRAARVEVADRVQALGDPRTYRLVQDHRHVCAVLHGGEGAAARVGAVTACIARRLVEREQLPASFGRDLPTAAAPSAVEPVAKSAEAPIRSGALTDLFHSDAQP